MQTKQQIVNLAQIEEEFVQRLIKTGKSINTVKNYRTDLGCFNSFVEKERPSKNIDDFELSHLEQYNSYLQKKYSSNNSKRRRIQTLRMFFDFLVEKGLFATNPVRKFQTSPKFLDIPRPAPFSDIKTLWEFLITEEKTTASLSKLITMRNQILFLLIYGAALKVSEIKNLKVKDVILPDNSSKANSLARVMINHSNRDPYTIPIPEIFTHFFSNYILALNKQKELDGTIFDDLLFNANPYHILSGGLSARGQEIIFEEFRKKLMLKITPKSLRQAAIFRWIRAGHKETQIKEWLGVVPSYSLRPYRDQLETNIYNDEFMLRIYKQLKL